jgi:ubiquinone/menaquinone biosynthesis C-methylase UbiE
MATDYNDIAKEYQASKLLPWRIYAEAFTFFNLIGDLNGKEVLDLACGEGFYSRQFKLRGALHVTGVDISSEMIALALESELQKPIGIEYHVADVLTLDLNYEYDCVCASYLLNYAKNAEELQQMLTVISRHLKPGGKFITINSNPDYRSSKELLRKYGFTRENIGTEDGAETIYCLYLADGTHINIINYNLSKIVHEKAFQHAGFSNVTWAEINISPEGEKEFGEEYWKEMIMSKPVISILATK